MSEFICSADWHLRSTIPTCCSNTKSEWMNIQRNCVKQVVNYAIKNKCNVFIVGDLYHKVDDISFECLDITLEASEELKKHGLKLYYIAGNHDLKHHSINNLKDSACGVLSHYDNCILLNNNTFPNTGASSFGELPEDKEIVFMHTLCIPEKDKPDYVDCETPSTLASKFNNAKFIFLGDYHKHFVEKVKNKSGNDCFVVNPGCLTIQASDFQKYEPSVYLVNTDIKEFEELQVWSPEQTFITASKSEQKDKSIETFIEAVKNNEEVTLDYISNLQKAMLKEKQEVKDKITSWI